MCLTRAGLAIAATRGSDLDDDAAPVPAVSEVHVRVISQDRVDRCL